ncbi:MAG: hypothetical protein RQ715_03660, partial [Methylococcales bacterium]|nr:hypothetical protein [Methylococcales bacterium]
VGAERCHIVIYDDFASNPRQVYQAMLAFLDLPDDGRCDFQRKRYGKSFRHGGLQRLLKRPPQKVRSVLAGPGFRVRKKSLQDDPRWKAWLIQKIMAGRQTLLRWNAAPSRRQPLTPEIRQEIHDLLKEDIARLGCLLNRDLSHWLRVAVD